MAPKKEKDKGGAPAAAKPEGKQPPAAASPSGSVARLPTAWSLAANYKVQVPKDKIPPTAGYSAKGRLRLDFRDLSEALGVVPHPAVAPRQKSSGSGAKAAESASQTPPEESPHLTAQLTVFDHATFQILRHVLSTSLHLQVIRFSACNLDVEMLGDLRAGLTDASTVITLQVDWNPLEVPPEEPSSAASPEEIDVMEGARLRNQAERGLRLVRELLEVKFGSLEAGLQALLQELRRLCNLPEEGSQAFVQLLTSERWCEICTAVLDVSSAFAADVFHYLEGPAFGKGEGRIWMAHVHEVLSQLRPTTASADDSDRISLTWAAFADATSPLEALSLRHCHISSLECSAISKAVRGSMHLRVLNLWNNFISDKGAGSLGNALSSNSSIQQLSLARNRVTHEGMKLLCEALGYTIIAEKSAADAVIKQIREQQKDKEKKFKKPPEPKVDGKGRARYSGDYYHIDACEELKDASGHVSWLWSRNTSLKRLSLEHNPISDASAVLKLQPHGSTGSELVLTGVPCAPSLQGAWEKARKDLETGSSELGEWELDGVKLPRAGVPSIGGGFYRGWALVLQST